MFPGLRTQIAARNFRVPDMLVVRAGESFDRYVTSPPLIAIEILSPEDRLTAFQEKAGQYWAFGIENIWVVDPEAKIAYRYTGSSLEEERRGKLAVERTPIQVDLAEMFRELDRT